jgi:hypothetical protein
MRGLVVASAFWFVAACASGPPRPAPERAAPAPTPPPTAAPAPSPVASEEGEHTVLRNDVLDILDRGIPWFLRQIDTEPELDRGAFVGFRLTAFFANDTRFRAVDLVPGDVVLRVNGLPIERPEHAYRIWQELRVASEIRVEYLRAGQPRQIDYAIVDSGS